MLEELANTKPIAVEYARKGTFLNKTDREFEVGMPTSEALSRDALLRDGLRSTIEGILQKASGEKLSLIVTLKDGLSVPAPPAAEIEEEVPAEPVEEEPSAEASSEPASAGGEAARADDDIHDDPLIKDALRIFEAEIQ